MAAETIFSNFHTTTAVHTSVKCLCFVPHLFIHVVLRHFCVFEERQIEL